MAIIILCTLSESMGILIDMWQCSRSDCLRSLKKLDESEDLRPFSNIFAAADRIEDT